MDHLDDKELEAQPSRKAEPEAQPPLKEVEIDSLPPEEAPPELSEEEKLQKRVNELTDQYLRTLAEYDNFRKRSLRERDEIYPNATAAAIEKFLPILDNFQRAMEYECEEGEFKKGIVMIYQNLKEVMESFGVEPVGTVGEAFDPAYHNAVMHIEDENLGENVVSQVLQKGYKIGNRVLRYAMVQTAN